MASRRFCKRSAFKNRRREAFAATQLLSNAARAPTSKDLNSSVLFKELPDALPKDGPRANSARLELEYWRKHHKGILSPTIRKPVKTLDWKLAEAICITSPAWSMPGNDFSMAFLLIDKHIVDWASCWTHNRSANQTLVLEDVDGDGFTDVAFQARKGWRGLRDNRQHIIKDDKRKWMYAYAITGNGFKSLTPETAHDVGIKMTYDTAGQPIDLQVKGLPESFRRIFQVVVLRVMPFVDEFDFRQRASAIRTLHGFG